jgi:hypothetical protein
MNFAFLNYFPSLKTRPTQQISTSHPTNQPLGNREFRIKNRWIGNYITLTNQNLGATILLQSLNVTWLSQVWYLQGAEDADFPLHQRLYCKWGGNMYLNAKEERNNAAVVGWNLQRNWWSMRWSLNLVENNIYRIVNIWSNRCLSVGKDPNAPSMWILVEVYDCNENWWSQQWILEAA